MLMTPLLWAKLAVLGGLVAFGAWQTVRLAGEKAAHGETRVSFAEHRTLAERASRVQTENFAAQASGWRKTQLENSNAHRTFTDELLGQLALSRAAGDRLQLRADQLRAAAGQAPRDSGAQPTGPTAQEAGLLLADLFKRADARAGELAEFADRANAAGELCQRDYEALSR